MQRKTPKWLRKWRSEEERSKKVWYPYGNRNVILNEIGFMSYDDYLRSELWSQIRSRVLSLNPHCACCSKAAELVHHDAYYRKLLLGDEKSVERDLYPLCHACHYTVEFEGNRKRSFGEAVRQFRRMLYKHHHGESKSEMIARKRNQRKSMKKMRLSKQP